MITNLARLGFPLIKPEKIPLHVRQTDDLALSTNIKQKYKNKRIQSKLLVGEDRPEEVKLDDEKILKKVDILVDRIKINVESGVYSLDVSNKIYELLQIFEEESYIMNIESLNHYLDIIDGLSDVIINSLDILGSTKEKNLTQSYIKILINIKRIIETMINNYNKPLEEKKIILEKLLKTKTVKEINTKAIDDLRKLKLAEEKKKSSKTDAMVSKMDSILKGLESVAKGEAVPRGAEDAEDVAPMPVSTSKPSSSLKPKSLSFSSPAVSSSSPDTEVFYTARKQDLEPVDEEVGEEDEEAKPEKIVTAEIKKQTEEYDKQLMDLQGEYKLAEYDLYALKKSIEKIENKLQVEKEQFSILKTRPLPNTDKKRRKLYRKEQEKLTIIDELNKNLQNEKGKYDSILAYMKDLEGILDSTLKRLQELDQVDGKTEQAMKLLEELQKDRPIRAGADGEDEFKADVGIADEDGPVEEEDDVAYEPTTTKYISANVAFKELKEKYDDYLLNEMAESSLKSFITKFFKRYGKEKAVAGRKSALHMKIGGEDYTVTQFLNEFDRDYVVDFAMKYLKTFTYKRVVITPTAYIPNNPITTTEFQVLLNLPNDGKLARTIHPDFGI